MGEEGGQGEGGELLLFGGAEGQGQVPLQQGAVGARLEEEGKLLLLR